MALDGMPADYCSYTHEPVPCGASDFAADAMTWGGACFEGDYYAQDDMSICRGVTLPAMQAESRELSLQCGKLPAEQDLAADTHFEYRTDFVTDASRDFEEGSVDATPEVYPICQGTSSLPASSFLLDVSQAEAFEALERHFKAAEFACITKLRPAKGCLTVQVLHHGGHWSSQSEIKVRLHPKCSQESSFGSQHGLAVVFERRGGDALAFAQIFRRVRAALQAPGACVSADILTDFPAVAEVHTEAADKLTLEEMQPLMDMLSEVQPFSVQLAALNALVTLAMPSGKMPVVVCQALQTNEALLANVLTKTAFDHAAACLVALVAALAVESVSECFARALLGIASDRLQAGVAEQKIKACWVTVMTTASPELASSAKE
eukprot:TRINITY_DN70_c0_g1_i1.p1 TRINITY_DN70_c0_g1~~TRINITY_DN70_c0_g1_i1.p1  ORF type:complete len:378 (-),score=83.77 TRINITY_DN70_c0_g1_i1:352-1485(-)